MIPRQTLINSIVQNKCKNDKKYKEIRWIDCETIMSCVLNKNEEITGVFCY